MDLVHELADLHSLQNGVIRLFGVSVIRLVEHHNHASERTNTSRLASLPADPIVVARVVPQSPALAVGAPAALHHMTVAEMVVTKTPVYRCLFGTMRNPFDGSTRIS
jgi:hypothetical protein